MADLEDLSAIVGLPVVRTERAAMGHENRTDIVTLADGQRRVVQRISDRRMARHKTRLAQRLPERFAAVGIRLPQVVAADPDADPPSIVREYIPGTMGAALLESDAGAIWLAGEMGACLPRLARVSTVGLGLHSSQADPIRLEQRAHRQYRRWRHLFDDATCRALERILAAVVPWLAGRTACFAHGDFCPVNALVGIADDQSRATISRAPDDPAILAACRLIALLDVEWARLADPLFDAAWWGWVVRFHHPQRWRVAWPHFLAAAGIPNDAQTSARLTVLQVLRCLEALDYYAALRPDAVDRWAQRVRATVQWGAQPPLRP